jgi:hypothetical protein
MIRIMIAWITWICRRVERLFQGWEAYQCLHELGYVNLTFCTNCANQFPSDMTAWVQTGTTPQIGFVSCVLALYLP